MGEGETVSPASPSTFVPNKIEEAEAIKLISQLTYNMPEKDVIRFLERKGLRKDCPSIGDSFGWSDGFSFLNGTICLTMTPKHMQPNGDWISGLLKEAFINRNDGKEIRVALKNAP
jgi:hypothetical protein